MARQSPIERILPPCKPMWTVGKGGDGNGNGNVQDFSPFAWYGCRGQVTSAVQLMPSLRVYVRLTDLICC